MILVGLLAVRFCNRLPRSVDHTDNPNNASTLVMERNIDMHAYVSETSLSYSSYCLGVMCVILIHMVSFPINAIWNKGMVPPKFVGLASCILIPCEFEYLLQSIFNPHQHGIRRVFFFVVPERLFLQFHIFCDNPMFCTSKPIRFLCYSYS